MSPFKQQIRYESQRDLRFADEIMATPGCEDLGGCIQCGTCSGVCPLSIYMDHTPRNIINLARAGFKDDVLTSNTIWLCASCYHCTVECPKSIKITDIMYALKQRAIKDGVYRRGIPIPVLAREFFNMVRRNGRVTENWLATILYLKTDWLAMLKMGGLGLKLIRTGRFSFTMDHIEGREQLRKLLEPSSNNNTSASQGAKQ
ncbi:MAG: 4Fe-4S dicluster domain-containing protein [Elusimicrobiota bacterium]|jgi:heterodisulfide reductase subunit C